jgi:exonuclease VII small subunit
VTGPLPELAHALSELERAEQALDAAMSALEVAPRAQKIAISGALEQALDRLRSARTDLHALEELAKKP